MRRFCGRLSELNSSYFQEKVEAEVSTLNVLFDLANTLPLLFSCPLLGAWSDMGGGRIAPLMIALVFKCLSKVPMIVTSTLFWVSTYWVGLCYLLAGIGGDIPIVAACCFAIITDEAQKHSGSQITIRLSIGLVCLSLGTLISSALAIFLQKIPYFNHRYYEFFLINQGAIAIAALYTAFVAKETWSPAETEGEQRPTKSICLVALEKLKAGWLTVIAPREGNKRFCLILSLLLKMLLMTSLAGRNTVLTSF